MDDLSGASSQSASNENSIPQFSANCEQPSTHNNSYGKINGEHSVPQQIFSSDDESSSTSSSSSRNLIIDHPDENSKDGTGELKPVDPDLKKHNLKNEIQSESSKGDAAGKRSVKSGGMKRKLTLREMTVPLLPKKRRHSTKSLDLKTPYKRPVPQAGLTSEFPRRDDHGEPGPCSRIQDIPKNHNNFREYASYLGLKPASIPIKCFKCSNSNFENLTQLRDHQKICLFKDKQRNLTPVAKSESCVAASRQPENLSNEQVTKSAMDISNATPLSNGAKENPSGSCPGANTAARAKKRVFLCSACGTYYENWNLFLHMREVHKRHICLYCIGMFPSAERLTFHLEMKHDLEQNHYDCREKLLRSSRESCYLMCCVCEHIFTEHDDFSDHKCAEHLQPCALCGQKGRHLPSCKASGQATRLKHKDHHTKRKSKIIDKELKLQTIQLDITAEKRTEPVVVNGGNEAYPEEASILRKIITEGEKPRITNTDETLPSILKVNGCTEQTGADSLETINQSQEDKTQTVDNVNENNELNVNATRYSVQPPVEKVDVENVLPCNSSEPPPPDECDVDKAKDEKVNESVESSQSNTTSELTGKSSSPEHDLNDSRQSSSISQVEESPVESKPLLVPKFKIKVPKEFQTPLESEESSTESDDMEIDRSDNGEEEQSDGSDMDIEEEEGEGEEELPVEESTEKSDEQDVSLEDAKPESRENKIELEEEKKNFEIRDVATKAETSPKEELQEQCEEHNISTASTSTDNEKPLKEETPSTELLLADEDVPLQELLLEQPLDKIDMVSFMRICLRATYRFCLYCNHARQIAVNGHSFVLHLISQHRFSAIVDSITAEELQPSTIVQKLKGFIDESENVFFNLETYCSEDKEHSLHYEKVFECFQCRFETRIHKELYLHNRKMHLKTAILCFMCRSNFFSYSEILCHMCPGVANKFVIFDIKFRCCLCAIDNIPSAFRLMVHLRKKHFACDVCLEDCYDQSRLSSHVWKHKLHHLCYRCGIAYRNKPDITKHLFWKHGTESVLCKRCLQKRWPHVYHFCIPPASFVCETCNLTFSRAMALKVHKRLHSGDAPYPCPEDECDQKFISRKLLLKHSARHNEEPVVSTDTSKEEENKVETETEKSSEDSSLLLETGKEQCLSETPENISNETKEDEEERNQSKKKRKRSKRNKENLDDLMDLPAPNLSESDSSDETDGEKSKSEKLSTPVPNVILSPPSELDAEDDVNISNSTGTQIIDIWENFKTFQASQQAKTMDNDSDDNDDAPAPSILHVTQSDHDYCMMFKPISKLFKSSSKDDITEIKTDDVQAKEEHVSPKKKQKSPRKAQRSGSDSSSSGSSSSSDSSCSCGSNCSCSSSSSGSSDSSSSSETESSSSEGRRRAAARRQAKSDKKNQSKSSDQTSDKVQMQSPKTNTSDIVDVVTADPKSQELADPDSTILESDLETEESDTDEDFYDEHPQKLANQLLAEKRKQLLMQTSLSPSHNFDIVENSRPSTPSIPEEMVKEKKVKLKKKKREKKGPKIIAVPEFKLDIPTTSLHSPPVVEAPTTLLEPMLQAPVSDNEPSAAFSSESILPSEQSQLANTFSTSMPAPIAPKNRLSTGSSSDADGPLKRSKRRRRPNKFYGYSSDDDGAGAPPVFGSIAFKPTPPPNLTWRKEDLPTPQSKSSQHRTQQKSPAVNPKKSTPANTPPLPPIPPIIIRPSAHLSKKSMSVENATYKPPIVQPIRVPPVPVHHIRPPQYTSPNRDFAESDSSSDDEQRLTIMTTTIKKSSQSKQQSLNKRALSQQAQDVYPQQQPSKSTVSAGNTSTPINPRSIPPALLPNPDVARLEYFRRNNIRYPIQPPAGARPPREGESVYCYCRCPYDEVSEMIACDGDDCIIEWFHFECVGILVPPQGKWFCPECRPLYPNEIGSNTENT